MQVQSRLGPGSHGQSNGDYQNSIPVNGVHPSESRPDYTPSPTRHLQPEENGMHPYHQPQYGAPPGQQRQYPPPNHQLPPMYPSMGMAPMSAAGQGGVVYHPASQQGTPVGPPAQAQEKQLSFKSTNGTYHFELSIEQQPARARMCGFGDKDRRPITPPPCIKLIITNVAGEVVPPSEVPGEYFVLSCDLWDEQAQSEVNIVRSSSTSPAVSISTATMTSYPPIPERNLAPEYQAVMWAPNGQPMYAAPPGYPPQPGMPYGNPAYYPQQYGGPSQYPPSSSANGNSMYTRNLIGSLSVNASELADVEGEKAYWFVLQDLSVRTEGFFRLKMVLYDLRNVNGGPGTIKDRTACLAYVFSDKFQVFSAKKFPGVIESTPLSKCFAAQGIKIPIRKDVKADQDDDED
ncbi:velvet factor-domain-containing protein [Neohortaea acidophila]|uniref:Velvet factor-domain-containing protein n=1 Tax=Neohortaea acidophila TaxID=245834 RepID=A0A6A6PMV0_9PEZI|nr:velvet factor-domain-containing protein [Neohortaea acidophila]KAF2480587.1 velvet factor-domain-containing protein [Neohortaea acidophila]